MKLRVFNILKNTKVEGPGTRYCIWVQGCSRHCPGCQAQHTWDPNGGTVYDINEIITDILKNIDKIEGVTFLGGEPFEQAEALGEIAHICKVHARLSVVTFTGFMLEDLLQEKKNLKLLRNTDLLIDGPFEMENLDYSRPWCGSSNQRYHFFTKRYNDEIFEKYQNKVEVNILPNGFIFLNGMGNFEEIMQSIDLYGLDNWYDGVNSVEYDGLYGNDGYYEGEYGEYGQYDGYNNYQYDENGNIYYDSGEYNYDYNEEYSDVYNDSYYDENNNGYYNQ